MCRLAAAAVAEYGLASPGICHRWLPTWLPRISLAWPMFERSNTMPNLDELVKGLAKTRRAR
jgi:hypothetical protein